MSDLISRTGAIAHFDKVAEELDEQRGDDPWVGNAFKICLLGVVNDLAVLPSAEPQWIPVSERLPDLRTEVIYSFDGIVSTGYMTDRDYEGEKTESHWEDLESGVTIEPIAWMPLPEPYKGGDEK